MNVPTISRRQFTLLTASALTASAFPPLLYAAQQNQAGKTLNLPDGSPIPVLGMGTARLATGRHPIGEEEQALRAGLQIGMALIDTAEIYSNGISEQMVGRVIAGIRDKVFVVSKISPRNAGSAQSIRRSCERSLKNLNTGYMDLYLLHWPAVDNLSLVVQTFEDLKKEGKIRHWGVSNFATADMQKLFALEAGKNCAANQVRYSLADRHIETSGLLDWGQQNKLPLMAYTPLGRGGDLLKNKALATVAQKHQVSPAVIALAWTLRSGNVICVAESGNIRHIEENSKAQWLALDADDLAVLDKAFPA